MKLNFLGVILIVTSALIVIWLCSFFGGDIIVEVPKKTFVPLTKKEVEQSKLCGIPLKEVDFNKLQAFAERL